MELLNWILLALSSIVIVSYLFDALAHHSRVPSVVLLIFCGIAARLILDYFNLQIPLLDVILPIVGTLGLILIVLEGALDLRISRDNLGLIGRASLCSLLGLLITGGLVASLIYVAFDVDWRKAWLYAVPMAVISSAVAIPAASALSSKLKEFVIYESSLSDIMGVLLFYALLEGNGNFGTRAITSAGTLVISLAVGVLSALVLYWLISRIEAHVRFVPMIAGIALLILLILSLPDSEVIADFPQSAVMLLILMSALLLAYGNLRYGRQQQAASPPTEPAAIVDVPPGMDIQQSTPPESSQQG
ncbi:cation:proton antiporter [Cellvibrio japonicus]|uniref:Putative membrane protein n=1 Tax=Cellvibrio japonicus (strain Ueda107) TaxID=498211 RepID=B3PL71_CELJU|nr:hypothetical protein [Cellvibrio japonicus]ACE83635.1 putative membrane protein [Cellvibrio japonicus Ueda107]QEI11532.1 hypothetical protein FY117_04315 [Cellvibrio japonicus]QEI15106.1 hypothetical protein FY116_04315 [Cellvibrio japonicus]QEI18686.1 hypothetical protein FY115_04315 [Cellvibrio japonicus]